LGPIYRRTGHPSICRPGHTDRVVGRRFEEPRLADRIRRRHTTAALSAMRAHRGTECSNRSPPAESQQQTIPVLGLRWSRGLAFVMTFRLETVDEYSGCPISVAFPGILHGITVNERTDFEQV
jgi:hypothetical protein